MSESGVAVSFEQAYRQAAKASDSRRLRVASDDIAAKGQPELMRQNDLPPGKFSGGIEDFHQSIRDGFAVFGKTPYIGWTKIRQEGEADGAVFVIQSNRFNRKLHLGCDLAEAVFEKPSAVIQPLAAVVVAGYHQNFERKRGKLKKKIIEQRHRVARRQGAVVYIACDKQDIRLFLKADFYNGFKGVLLIFDEIEFMLSASQMKVGDCEQLHFVFLCEV